MGLLPDMLPGYTPVTAVGSFAEYNAPTTPGLDILEIFDAAGKGELSALYVVGSNPISRYGVDPATLKESAGSRETALAILEFLLANEDLLVRFCEDAKLRPEAVHTALHRLDRL